MVTSSDRATQDLALLERIVRGDGSAIGALYDRHARVVFAVVCRIVRDEGEAEDILQEAFLRVWQKADTYDPALGTPAGWLIRIARNRAIDRLRARRARPVTGPEDDALLAAPVDEDAIPGPERSTAQAEERSAIAAALDHLPAEQRVLIEQAFFQGYTQSELAEKFCIPLGTVTTRIRTGMIALRERLQYLVQRVGESMSTELDELVSLVAETLAAEGTSATSVGPAFKPGLRGRLMAEVSKPARFTVTTSEGEWATVGIPGISMKVLSLDKARDSAVLLVRGEAGARYPAHCHSKAEECFVISGEVLIHGQMLKAGDFHHAEPDSDHDELYTPTGVEVLLVVSATDYGL